MIRIQNPGSKDQSKQKDVRSKNPRIRKQVKIVILSAVTILIRYLCLLSYMQVNSTLQLDHAYAKVIAVLYYTGKYIYIHIYFLNFFENTKMIRLNLINFLPGHMEEVQSVEETMTLNLAIQILGLYRPPNSDDS